MKSIRELYRIGTGPSSSHTMGPRRASAMFAERTGGASKYIVTLYGALAATGKGHLTDVAITDTLSPLAPVEIEWQPNVFLPYHPNGMKFTAMDAEGNKTDEWTVFSIGVLSHTDSPLIEFVDLSVQHLPASFYIFRFHFHCSYFKI